MVVTVTLNPLLERRFEYDIFHYGKSNRDSTEYLIAGGKGINVSRQLSLLNIQNTAFTFAGGMTGKLFKKLLSEENISASFVQIKDETRNGTSIVDKKSKVVTSLFGKNSDITPAEADEFLSRLERMIQNSEIVVLSGSSPSEVTDHIFPSALEICNKLDKISVLDTYGSHLQDCLDASPAIVHINREELKELYRITDEESILSQLDHLYSKGIKQVFITNGENPVYASNFDFHYKAAIPVIDTNDATGSGDAFTAGIVYGWHHNLTFEKTLNIASCLGIANAASYKICSSMLHEAVKYESEISIQPVGKKIKAINVNPQ